jgi:hypothetical protein
LTRCDKFAWTLIVPIGSAKSASSASLLESAKPQHGRKKLAIRKSWVEDAEPGVKDVVPIKVFTNNYRASLDIVVFYGMPPNKVRTSRDIQLIEGDWSEFEKHRDGALIGRKGVFEARAVGDLAEMIHFTNYLGYACVVLVLCLVATTTVMAVQDRVREHALLQTLGFSGTRIFGLVMSESLLVTLAGGILGISAALIVLAWSHLAVGTQGVTIAFMPSFELALTGLGVTMFIGVLGGIAPAWQASRADIVSSLRYT